MALIGAGRASDVKRGDDKRWSLTVGKGAPTLIHCFLMLMEQDQGQNNVLLQPALVLE